MVVGVTDVIGHARALGLAEHGAIVRITHSDGMFRDFTLTVPNTRFTIFLQMLVQLFKL